MRNIRDILSEYANKEEGATAIELSFVVLPLTYFLVGIVEVALMFTASIVLEGSTSDAARLIRTGQVQQSANAAAGQQLFEDTLCNAMAVLADCEDIDYEVINLGDSFGNAAGNSANFDDDGSFTSSGFDAGGVSDVVLIRAVYQYPIKTPVLSEFFADPGSDTRLMMSTVVLQTEPYDFED